MIDTLRLILFKECNLRCYYCCNEQTQFNSKFVEKSFDEIDFALYKNVCLTGGEPFLNKILLYSVMDKIPNELNIYIYTNGIPINLSDIDKLKTYSNLKCLNVGLHFYNQCAYINPQLEKHLPIRWMIQDIKIKGMMEYFPHRFKYGKIKLWKLNDCFMPNEDWVILSRETKN